MGSGGAGRGARSDPSDPVQTEVESRKRSGSSLGKKKRTESNNVVYKIKSTVLSASHVSLES